MAQPDPSLAGYRLLELGNFITAPRPGVGDELRGWRLYRQLAETHRAATDIRHGPTS